ncbi:MAG: DUF190 domain-containing protein [SAR324 cluster bacterium]|nr:DUF190 domain-containing protein [SAR324 cluster bacterium]
MAQHAGEAMAARQKAKLLRIFVEETDKWHHKPLYEEIVRAARRQGLAEATVLRGIESYGASSQVHTAKVLRLAEHLPLVIEIVDSEQRIEAFLAPLDELLIGAGGGGLVTLEAVEAISYAPAKKN